MGYLLATQHGCHSEQRMKRLASTNISAFLTACALTLSLSATWLQGDSLDSGGASLNAGRDHDPDHGAMNGSATRDTDIDAEHVVPTPQLLRPALPGHPDPSLRKEYRGFSSRLDSVSQRIDRAQREGRYTPDQADLHRADVAKIQARFKKKDDGQAQKLRSVDRARMEKDVKAQEGMVNEIDKH
jgi:hypothetical protein